MKQQQWCEYHKCWCEDVQEMTDFEYTCELKCSECKECILKKRKKIKH